MFLKRQYDNPPRLSSRISSTLPRFSSPTSKFLIQGNNSDKQYLLIVKEMRHFFLLHRILSFNVHMKVTSYPPSFSQTYTLIFK